MTLEFLNGGALIRAEAPAKINLFFEILGKRDDGYHEVETLVAPIDLCDRLEFYLAPRDDSPFARFALEVCDDRGAPIADVPTDSRNLVARAVELFARECERSGARVRNSLRRVKLTKRIPTRAGLGGGSSDAATTLVALNALLDAPLAAADLFRLAARLGSDVPLFLVGGGAVCRGRGELVEPYDVPELHLALVKPVEGVATAAAYALCDARATQPRRSLDDLLTRLSSSKTREEFDLALAAGAFNRLEEACDATSSALPRWRAFVGSARGALTARTTGSGSASYALFRTRADALSGVEELRTRVAPGAYETLCASKSVGRVAEPFISKLR